MIENFFWMGSYFQLRILANFEKNSKNLSNLNPIYLNYKNLSSLKTKLYGHPLDKSKENFELFKIVCSNF